MVSDLQPLPLPGGHVFTEASTRLGAKRGAAADPADSCILEGAEDRQCRGDNRLLPTPFWAMSCSEVMSATAARVSVAQRT